MQEYLWEIWTGNKNTHHRTQMDVNETPRTVMQRTVRELEGTDKAIPTTRRDPNTGQRTEVKWKFAWRSQGKEAPLKSHLTFADQGVQPGSLIVVREIEVRAHTIYIDGFDGLQGEELAAARSKTPMIAGLLLLLLVGGGAGFYFLYWAPKQAALAPYSIDIPTTPKGAKLTILMKVPKKQKASPVPAAKAPKKANKDEIDEQLTTVKVTLPAKRVKIPKKAQIIYMTITKKGYKPWSAGHELKVWNKDRIGARKLLAIDAREVTVKNYFPKKLERLPPEPKIPSVPAPKPTPLVVKYPRRWRRFRVGIDPMDGGLDHQGAMGITKASSDVSLALATTITKHLTSKRRRFRVTQVRKRDIIIPSIKRARLLRRKRVKAVIQLAFASGIKELPKASKTLKKGAKLIPYNDAVGGFQILISKHNKAHKKAHKLATCLGKWMKKAGFTPRKARKGEPKTVEALGIRTTETKDPVLSGRIPSVRLLPGYITHRGEDAILNKKDTQKVIAQAIEAALICYKKR